MRRWLVLALLLGSAFTFAQNPPATRPVIWDQGQLVLDLEPGSPARIPVEGPDKKIVRSIPVPEGTLWRDYFQGEFFITRFDQETQKRILLDGGKSRDSVLTLLLEKRAGNQWTRVAAFQSKAKGVFSLVPLKNGNFLAYTDRANGTFKVDGGYSPIGILEADKHGMLHPARSLDPGFSLPVWSGPIDEWGHAGSNFKEVSFGYSSTLLRVPGHIILAAERIGYFWVFSDEDGRLERRVILFDCVDEERLKHPGETPHVGLGVHPRPNGHLLIASRSRSAVEQAGRAFRSIIPESERDDPKKVLQWWEKTKPLRDLNLKEFPDVSWWDLDPETGAVTPETPPQKFPDKILSANQLWNWNWRFRADANLLYFPTEDNQPETKTARKFLGIIPVR